MTRRPKKNTSRISLHPLSMEEALADMLRVKPPKKNIKPSRRKKAKRGGRG